MVSLIVAASLNDVIGVNNTLPWKLSSDLKMFRELTTHHTVIMGRKTFDSIGKALPNRKNIVITSDKKNVNNSDVLVSSSLIHAISTASLLSHSPHVFIIGGGMIYKEALEQDLVERVYLTRVYTKVEGDTFFPHLDKNKWIKISNEEINPPDEKNQYMYAFEIWERKEKVKNVFDDYFQQND